jgi:hypothetical protein
MTIDRPNRSQLVAMLAGNIEGLPTETVREVGTIVGMLTLPDAHLDSWKVCDSRGKLVASLNPRATS